MRRIALIAYYWLKDQEVWFVFNTGKIYTYKMIAKAELSPLPFTSFLLQWHNYKTFIKNQEINLDTWVLTKVQALFKYYHFFKNTAIFLLQPNPGFQAGFMPMWSPPM